MKTILLIEDNAADAAKILCLLESSLSAKYEFTLVHKAGTEDALAYLSANSPDLILMDLEMTKEHQTTMGIIDQVSPQIPIIVISHLSHYQKPSLRHGNVVDFVPKSNLYGRLVDRILQVFSPKSDCEPEEIEFPGVGKDGVAEKVPIHKISYIYLVGRGRYDIHLTDETVQSLRSVLFRDLLRILKNSHIISLRPVSRNEIINVNYIADIKRTPAGRLELTMIGNDDHLFRIGEKYQKQFEEEFM